MRALLLATLALFSTAVLHGLSSGRWIGSLAATFLLIVPLVVRARLSLTPFSQRVFAFIAAAAGGSLAWIEAPESTPSAMLARGWSVMAIAALFAAAFRSFLRDPEGGLFATLVVGLIALVASGETRTEMVYPLFVTLHLILAFAALRAADPGRPKVSSLGPRTYGSVTLLLLLAAAVTAAFAVVLPPLSFRLRDRILTSMGVPMTGLGERMVLGSLEGMLESDEIVARVHGPPVDYLRGVVYDHYQAGQWAVSTIDDTRTVPTAPMRGEGPSRVRVEILGGSRPERFLVPLGAAAVSVPDGKLVADRFGALRPIRGGLTTIEFDLPPTTAPLGAGDFPPSAPTTDDRRRPVKLARDLAPLVRAWTEGKTDPEERVFALARHLEEHGTYSLNYARGPGDPILDFLREHPQGHCEYFASAMAMLARSAGIPARVVAGYRVAERNELGGYSIVRQKNAHAWVEVYIEGKGWITVDPTPPDLLAQNTPHQTPFFAAVADVLSARWAAFRENPEIPSLPELIAFLFAVVAVGLAVRWWTQRRRAQPTSEHAFFRAPDPPQALARLLTALARTGIPHDPTEPLERLIARLASLDREAAALLDRYVALRYGGVGEGTETALFAEMDACAARLKAPEA
ncbi:MAG: transglutaminaseTgpA domain-containing protein [Polyangiaceae bacterium]